ncbi:MAG TPA: hypothetical protein VNI01_07720 [Elusimicrobiota bacterium]|nr:hypothetical protein [Elusimicrobiota bacterium]
MKGAFLSAALLVGASTARAATPWAQAMLGESMAAAYNFDFDQAEARIRDLERQEPDNPYGPLGEAGLLWWRAHYDDPSLRATDRAESRFIKAADKAYRGARDRFGEGDDATRADAYLAAGTALGLKGLWALDKGQGSRAYSYGREAAQLLGRCLKLDPTVADAELGLGLFEYYAATRRGRGKKGSVDQALHRLQIAAEQGRLLWSQAALSAAYFHSVERGDYKKALPLLEKLRGIYFDSPLFRVAEVAALYKLNNWNGSWRQAKALIALADQDPQFFIRRQRGAACGFFGPRCLGAKSAYGVIEWFSRALEAQRDVPEGWKGPFYFWRGAAQDLRGAHDLASRDYARCLREPEVARFHAWAQHCTDGRCSRADLLRLLGREAEEEEP